MPKLRSFQTNFSSGQVDEKMRGRADTKMYQNAAADLTNNALLVQGGVARRPGSAYLANLGATGRLFGFIFSAGQVYLWHFKDLQIKVYSLAGALIATITTPWPVAILYELRWAQAGDTVIVTHPDHEPRRILRTSATAFSIATLPWENVTFARPYFKHAASSITLTFGALSGAGVSCTASAAAFVAGQVGEALRVVDETGASDVISYATITGFTSTTVVTVTLSIAISAVGPHSNWAQWAYSSLKGWPAACAFHAQRLCLAGGDNLPSSFYATAIGEYFNFDLGEAEDDEGIAYTIAVSTGSVSKVHSIQHLVSTKHMIVLTDQAEFFAPESETRPFTPDNFGIRLQTPYGSSSVPPQFFDSALLVVQNAGRAVREMKYEEFQQIYSADAISLIATDVLGGVIDSGIIYGNEDRPEQYAFFVRDDGKIAVFHGVRSEKIAAWCPWETDGSYIAITAVNDRLFSIVERSINGSTVYYLEEFKWSYTLDCALAVSGASSATWAGLSHLEAEEVHGVNGNLYYGTGDVASASVTFDEAAEDLVIGLDYDRTIEMLPPATLLPEGTIIGELKRITKITTVLHETANLSVQGQELLIRRVTDDLSLEPDSVTGIRYFYIRGWSREGIATITQTAPLPATVLAVAVEIIV